MAFGGSNAVAGKITVRGEVKTHGFADFKAKLDLAIGSARKMASALDEVMDRGGKYTALLDSQSISIAAARDATAGLVDDYTLLASANRAAALGLGLTEKQFADLAGAATIMSKKLGTDAADAVNDLITGIGRQSMAILDNLGIIVKAEDANNRYAAQIGKTAAALTDSEKRIAFQEVAIRKLKEATADAAEFTGKAADAWTQLKVAIRNSWDAFTRAISQSSLLASALKTVSEAAQGLGKAISMPAVERARFELAELRKEVGRLEQQLDAARAKGRQGFPGSRFGAAAYAGDEANIAARLARARARVTAAEEKVRAAQRAKIAQDTFGPPSPTKSDTGTGGEGGELARERAEALAEAQREIFNEQIRVAAERQQAEVARAAAIQRNIPLLESQMAANDNWAQSELRNQEILQNSVQYLNDLSWAQEYNAQKNREAAQSYTDVAMGLGDFTTGLWMAADAAIQSGESFGSVVAKMVRQELYGVAARASVLALYYTGLGFAALAGFLPTSAGQYFAAAGIMAGVAGAAGATAVGMSMAAKPSGGAGGRGRAGGAGMGPGVGRTADKERKEKREINVTVFLGDKYDRSAAKWHERATEAFAA